MRICHTKGLLTSASHVVIAVVVVVVLVVVIAVVVVAVVVVVVVVVRVCHTIDFCKSCCGALSIGRQRSVQLTNRNQKATVIAVATSCCCWLVS